MPLITRNRTICQEITLGRRVCSGRSHIQARVKQTSQSDKLWPTQTCKDSFAKAQTSEDSFAGTQTSKDPLREPRPPRILCGIPTLPTPPYPPLGETIESRLTNSSSTSVSDQCLPVSGRKLAGEILVFSDYMIC